MPLETRYEVSTQVAWLPVADMLPAICGSATLAILESSASMKVAIVIVKAIGHGLIAYLRKDTGLAEPVVGAALI